MPSIKKRPVKKRDLLTKKEIAAGLKIERWPLDKVVLFMCGVRKPWADDEYPPYGPPGKPTYSQLMAYVEAAAVRGELKTYLGPSLCPQADKQTRP